uniref:RNase H type-1 domain-containing protein n=1 Tax=Cajanus cajan TaxID=3821 RepID=A0A151U3F3_CAJCA|nr:hypothetical protein KK1_006484 [Cajanus cajan]
MAWTIELLKFNIHFEPRGPIKAQCLADFINELHHERVFEASWLIIHIDGSSHKQGNIICVILEGPEGITIEQSLQFGFKSSNNQDEYVALLVGLWLVDEMGAQKVMCYIDSKIAVKKNINGTFQIKEPHSLSYFHMFQRMKERFEEVQVKHTP